jgi:hypothetical protein
MLMPGLQKLLTMFFHQVLNLGQFPGIESIIAFQVYGVKPELGLVLAGFDMDVGWFLALVRRPA